VNVHLRNGFLNLYQMRLRKIPLGPILEILQDLFENGADYIDISGTNNDEGESPRDSIKITVKPEYLMDYGDDDDGDVLELDQEIEMDLSNNIDIPKSLSDEDINDLI